MPNQTPKYNYECEYIAMTRIVCWNIGKRKRPWKELLEMEVDVALLQEAGRPPSGLGVRSKPGLKTPGSRGRRVSMTEGRWSSNSPNGSR